MVMTSWVIGVPKQSPRMIATETEASAKGQLQAGEIYFPLTRWVPSPHVINAAGNALEPAPVSLASVRSARWQEAKLYRHDRLVGGCASPKGRIQTDDKSRATITNYARDAFNWNVQRQLAALGVSVTVGDAWSVNWTMADNAIVAHDAAAMIALANAVKAHDDACHSASQAIRAKIFAATTADAVAAVDVATGYPA